MFHSYFERKNDKVLTFNIAHFRNFEISVSLKLAPHLTVSKFNKRPLKEIRHLFLKNYPWQIITGILQNTSSKVYDKSFSIQNCPNTINFNLGYQPRKLSTLKKNNMTL